MKRFSLLFFVCLLVAIGLSLISPASAQKITRNEDKIKKSVNSIPNRYIVVLNEDVVKISQILPSSLKAQIVSRVSDDLAVSYGGEIQRRYVAALHGYAVEISPQQAEKLSQDPRVKYVEEDFVVYGTETQTNATWGLDRIDQHVRPLDSNYGYTTTGAGVHAYVLDSGIRATHSEFGGRVVFDFDAVNDGQNGNDCNGHGTHVAGTIGGATYGVAKQVTLHNVRVLGCNNRGTGTGILAGIDWIKANHANPSVVNMSIGMDAISPTVDDAITNSIAQGVHYAVAAGNSSGDACDFSPARTTNAITVGATDINDVRSTFSNYGACVDVFAPGTGITSAGIASDSATAVLSGTSMAAPHVVGVVARFLETNPAASPAIVENSIKTSATAGILTNTGEDSQNLLLYSDVVLNTNLPPPPGIIIPDSGPANPYPATYTVSGLSGVILSYSSVRVKIKGLNHTSPGDLSLVLEGPTGARLLIQSRVGGSNSAYNTSYTISDSGLFQMSNSVLINGGDYKPTALSALPSFPSPGPGTAYNNPGPFNGVSGAGFASTFGGTNPNGVWKLYVIDEFQGNGGSIANWSLSISTENRAPSDTGASFVSVDSATKGNWGGKYGSQGYQIVGHTSNFFQGFAQVSAAGQSSFTWADPTTDVRGLQKAADSSNRIAATYYTPTQFEMNFFLDDGFLHRLALYSLDWDNNNRQQTFELINTATGEVLDTRTISNFSGGVYVAWQVKGRFKVRVKNAGGNNAVLGGVFIDPPQGPLETSASFVGLDPNTKGDWVGNYGAEGYSIIRDNYTLPSWAQYSTMDANLFAWTDSTTDIRALRRSNNNNDRAAAALYSSSQFEMTFSLFDRQVHRFAIYSLDWEGINRNQTFELVDSMTNQILDSRTISNFNGGVYVVWKVSGKFKVRVRNNGGPNAVLSAVFLDSPNAPLPGAAPSPTPTPIPVDTSASFVGEDSYSRGNWVGNYGAQGYSIVGDTNTLPAPAQLSMTGQSNYTWVFSTTDVRALKKAGNNNDRIASTLYNSTQFDLNFYLTDGQTHRLALYALDWEGNGRRQTFELVNTDTGAVLDARTITNFNSGRYVVWNVKGKFTVRVKNAGGVPANSVLSGIFLDPAGTALPTLPPPPADTSASFVGTDNYTKGNWTGNYGATGNLLVTNPQAYFLPTGAHLNITGQNTYTWAASTSDPRALKKNTVTDDRIASTFYSPTEFDLDFDFPLGETHRIALYSLDWEGNGRKQTFELVSTENGAVLDTRSVTSFNGGVYTVWQVKGKVTVRVKNSGGVPANAVLSGIFLDPANTALPPPPPPDPTAASFVRFDANTKGNWLSNYGAQGHSVVNGTTNLLPSVQMSITGQSAYTWAASTADVRALFKAANPTDRIASTYYSPSQMELNLNLTDGQTHRLALYSLDWEGNSRQQTFEIVNTDTGVVLDTQTISNFNNGIYTVWQVRGKFTVRVKKVSGPNAVLSGIFLDSPSADEAAATFVGFDSTTKGNWAGGFGTQGYSVMGDVTNLPSWSRLLTTGQNIYTWAASTADVRAPLKAVNNGDRIAATFYTPSQMDLSFYLTDEQTHRLSVYSLDWEGNSREQTFELINTATGAVMDTRTVNNFNGGVYAVWQVKGKFTVRVKRVAGPNAVVSGVFIDNP